MLPVTETSSLYRVVVLLPVYCVQFVSLMSLGEIQWGIGLRRMVDFCGGDSASVGRWSFKVFFCPASGLNILREPEAETLF